MLGKARLELYDDHLAASLGRSQGHTFVNASMEMAIVLSVHHKFDPSAICSFVLSEVLVPEEVWFDSHFSLVAISYNTG